MCEVGVAGIGFALPAAVVGQMGEVDGVVNCLRVEGGVAGVVVFEEHGLFFVREGASGHDDDEVVDVLMQLVQPDLEPVKLRADGEQVVDLARPAACWVYCWIVRATIALGLIDR